MTYLPTGPATPRPRLKATIRALGAGIGLLLLLGVLPYLFAVTIGDPRPGWRDLLAGDASDTAVIAVLATITWLAWAQFALAVLAEIAAVLIRVPVPARIPGVLPGQQQMARAMVSAVFMLVPVLSPLTAQAHAATLPAATATPTAGPTPTVGQHPGSSSSSVKTVPHQVITIHTDGPGTYWDLAATYLGDGQRWSDIWHLNQGRHQDDGAHMTSPGLLRPGWTVLIPGSETTSQPPTSHGDVDVTVHPGDTLGQIAREHDTTWPHLWQDNRGHREPGGKHLRDPDHLEPGWTIQVNTPAPAHPHQDTSAAVAPAPAHPAAEHSTVAASVTTGPATTAPTARQSPGDSGSAGMLRHPGGSAAPTTGSGLGGPAPQAGDTSMPSPVWNLLVHGLGPGSGLLAAGALIALLRYRRRQFRYRRPGRSIGTTPAQLVAMERTLLAQGSQSLLDVTWLDEALRDLAQQLSRAGCLLPAVLAVRLNAQGLDLVLDERDRLAPLTPPRPWQVDEATGRWHLRRQDHTPDSPQQAIQRRRQFAPYPTLASVGYTSDGDYWLLDLEGIGALTLTGDRNRCQDLARFLAADLAHNSWSEQLEVTVAGLGNDLAAIHPHRLTCTQDTEAAITALAQDHAANLETLTATGLRDALQGRARDIAADQWMPHVLILDPTSEHRPHNPPLRDLRHTLAAQDARTAIALVLTGPTSAPAAESLPGWVLHVDAAGQLRIPALALSLNAQQLPAREAGQLARLLSAAATVQDQSMPPARGPAPWDALCDAAGAPVAHLTATPYSPPKPVATQQPPVGGTAEDTPPRTSTRIRLAPAHTGPDPATISTHHLTPHPDGQDQPPTPARSAETPTTDPAPAPVPVPAPEPAPTAVHPPVDDHPHSGDSAQDDSPREGTSVLPQPLSTLLSATATTSRDVQTLAPTMARTARHQVEHADTDLDQDLAAWFAADTTRPRLSLLGPVRVRSHGQLPDDRPREAWHTEIVAYLGAHPQGVSAAQLGTDLWPQDPDITSKSKLRQAVHLVRRWLGKDPGTGRPYLPTATTGGPSGVGLYRIEHLLCDADLFRRLRLRGVTRGSDGITDLETALSLVTGPPFDLRRPGGYGWLAEVPLDHEYTGMIVDVAHLVATHHLTTDHPDQAIAAAKISLSVASHDDIALLDLVAACDAQGDHGAAAGWVQTILANHDAEVEEDLPPRTAEILHRRRWITQAS